MKAIKLPEQIKQFHPCNCKSYNGGQCYNCLNGFHEGCKDNCKTKNSKRMGVKLIFQSTKN